MARGGEVKESAEEKRAREEIEYRFEVVAFTYAKQKRLGDEPKANLLQIGRDMGLTDKQINSVRLRATHRAEKLGKPKGVDDKRWLWPTANEIAQRAREFRHELLR